MTSFEPYIAQYFKHLRDEKNLAINTLESYERDLRQVVVFLTDQGIEQVEQVKTFDLMRYLDALEAEGKSSATISRISATLRSFFGYIYEERLIDENPAKRLKGPKVVSSSTKTLSLEEVDRLLSQPDTKEAIGKRDQVILELLYSTGLKVNEMLGLKLSDVHLELKFLKVSGRNGGRVIPLGDLAVSAIASYLEQARGELNKRQNTDVLLLNYSGEPLTRQGFWKIVKGYAKLAGLEDSVTPQALRQAFTMHLLERGANMTTVQQMLGHAGLNSTKAYTSVKQDRLQAFAGKLRPRE